MFRWSLSSDPLKAKLACRQDCPPQDLPAGLVTASYSAIMFSRASRLILGLHRQALHSRASVPGSAPAWPDGCRRNTRHHLKTYPYLESDDIDEALRYAAFLAEDDTV
jgi:hypothetical protein